MILTLPSTRFAILRRVRRRDSIRSAYGKSFAGETLPRNTRALPCRSVILSASRAGGLAAASVRARPSSRRPSSRGPLLSDARPRRGCAATTLVPGGPGKRHRQSGPPHRAADEGRSTRPLHGSLSSQSVARTLPPPRRCQTGPLHRGRLQRRGSSRPTAARCLELDASRRSSRHLIPNLASRRCLRAETSPSPARMSIPAPCPHDPWRFFRAVRPSLLEPRAGPTERHPATGLFFDLASLSQTARWGSGPADTTRAVRLLVNKMATRVHEHRNEMGYAARAAWEIMQFATRYQGARAARTLS